MKLLLSICCAVTPFALVAQEPAAGDYEPMFAYAWSRSEPVPDNNAGD
jgi:hypothetical protein